MSDLPTVQEAAPQASKMQKSLVGIFAGMLKQTKQIDRSMSERKYAEARGQVRDFEAYLQWALDELSKPFPYRS